MKRNFAVENIKLKKNNEKKLFLMLNIKNVY